MPDIADYFPHLNNLEPPQLHARRAELLGTAQNGDFNTLPDDALSELLAINRALVRKQAGPPRTKKTSISIEDIA